MNGSPVFMPQDLCSYLPPISAVCECKKETNPEQRDCDTRTFANTHAGPRFRMKVQASGRLDRLYFWRFTFAAIP